MAGPLADETVIGANGSVAVAPAGTALPTLAQAALGAGFLDLGYVTEDGVVFNDNKGKISVPAWNSDRPIRKIAGDQVTTVTMACMQWSEPVLEFTLGGSIAASGLDWKFSPENDIDQRAMVVSWKDGTRGFRLVIPRCEVAGEVEITLVRNNVVPIPLSVESVPGAAELPYFILTDDDAAFTRSRRTVTVDLDQIVAAEREEKREGPSVVLGGRTYVLAPEVPADVMLLVAELHDHNETNDVGAMARVIRDILKSLLGEDFDDFMENRPSMDLLLVMMAGVMEEYGVGLGESLASEDSSESTSGP